MNIFLICPVRDAEGPTLLRMKKYALNLEMEDHTVYLPREHTHQLDLIGVRICGKNTRAINRADEVHIWFDENSRGSLFDLGTAFNAGKKMVLANPDDVKPTSGKSFANIVLYLTGHLSYEDLVPSTPAPTKIVLTDEEWYSFDRDCMEDDDGALPACCGNVSDLRDVILDIGGHGGLMTPELGERLRQSWEDAAADHFDNSAAWTVLRKVIEQADLTWPDRKA